MSRPLGSKNKVKSIKNTFEVINLNKQIQNSPDINDKTSFAWTDWGRDNSFPMHLLDLYYNSITHHSCVDFLAQAICGEGIQEIEDGSSPNTLEDWNTFFHKIATDYILYGAFAFQIIKNKDGKSFSFFHQQIPTIRLSKKDEKGEIKTAWLSQDWKNTSQYRPIEIELINNLDIEALKSGKSYLYAFYDYNPFDTYYSSPNYIAALDAIKAEIEMKLYDYNSTLNSFTPSGVITLNQVADEDERKYILKHIKDTFTGSKNASNIIVTFRSSAEDAPVQFEPISSATENINKFADTNERIINRILAAHKIPSKALIGLPMDSTGFSNEGTLLETAYNLMEKTSIQNMRKRIVGVINKMFLMNGIDKEIKIKPLSFNLTNVNEVIDVVRKENTGDKEAQNENNEDRKEMIHE